MTTQHGKPHHSKPNDDDDWTSPAQVRRQKRMRSMMIVAVTLMLLGLAAYLLTNDESTVPGEGGEPMPLAE
ncbi:MAG: hypothetical protein MK085_05845 [Phycisphaerales bacterium]|nr:hypothetical protein [Phycisphaerales bacterium]